MHKTLLFILIFWVFSTFLLSAQMVEDTLYIDGTDKHLQLKNPEGNEFQLCFIQNYDDDNNNNAKDALNLELFITGDYDANVVIEVKGIKFKEELFIPAGTVKSIKLDEKAQITSYEVIEKGMSVQIVSDMPISVYGLSTRFQTTDTFLGLPNNVLGTEYRVMCYHKSGPRMPQFAVVATEDSTIVNITPRVITKLERPANTPFSIKLDKGDVYQVVPSSSRQNRSFDLTGSLIKSNKKISVFSGHQCAYVPAPPPIILACNHLTEQMPPISSWGKHFFIGRFEKRTRYTYRILADQPHTKVFINSKLKTILQPGQFYEGISDSTMQITADNPILVAQYSQGFKNGDLIGDPMMLLISPTQQFLKQYRFATPVNGFWNHYVNVVIPTLAINSLTLNGKNVNPRKFKQIGLSRYSIAHIEVDFGTHYITCNQPFGLYSYGFGFGDDDYDAYGTMGGQSFIEYIEFPDTLAPTIEIDEKTNTIKLIARDDRINDSGLKSVKEIFNEGFDVKIGNLDEGAPQTPITISLQQGSGKFARVVFEVEDMQGNKSHYTMCYNALAENPESIYSLTDDIVDNCKPGNSIYAGLFGKFSLVDHTADFYKMGELNSLGKFTGTQATGGYFGVEASMHTGKNIHLAARLSFDRLSGIISAPDSLIQSVRDPQSGNLTDLQEAYNLELTGWYASLSVAAQYYLSNYFYATGGLNISMSLVGKPELKRSIEFPANFVYENGSSEKVLDDIDTGTDFNILMPSIFGGVGLNVPVLDWLNAYSEINYNVYLSNVNSSGEWRINTLNWLIGLKVDTDIIFE